MNRSFCRISALCILVIFGVTSCASTTKLKTVWKDENYTQHIGNALIVACASEPATRRSLEDEFKRQLAESGTQVVPSYTIMPDPKEILDKQAVDEKIKPMGFDAVVVSRLVDEKTTQIYYPPERRHRGRAGYYGGSYGYYNGWHDYYVDSYDDVSRPGYTVEERTYVVETNVYSTEDDLLIYSALSKTSVTEITDADLRNFVTTLVQSLRKQGLL